MQQLNNIMLIDDNNIDSTLTRKIIERSGIQAKILECCSAEAALNILKMPGVSLPQLIFLDLNMPKMDGIAFLKAYRMLPRDHREKIVIVILTGSMNPTEHQQALCCGTVQKLLSKPLTFSDVETVVQTYFC